MVRLGQCNGSEFSFPRSLENEVFKPFCPAAGISATTVRKFPRFRRGCCQITWLWLWIAAAVVAVVCVMFGLVPF